MWNLSDNVGILCGIAYNSVLHILYICTYSVSICKHVPTYLPTYVDACMHTPIHTSIQSCYTSARGTTQSSITGLEGVESRAYRTSEANSNFLPQALMSKTLEKQINHTSRVCSRNVRNKKPLHKCSVDVTQKISNTQPKINLYNPRGMSFLGLPKPIVELKPAETCISKPRPAGLQSRQPRVILLRETAFTNHPHQSVLPFFADSSSYVSTYRD